MSKRKEGPTMVTFAVPLYKDDLEEFREYCKTIDADPRTVVYGFIKAVNNGQIDVVPPSNVQIAVDEMREALK